MGNRTIPITRDTVVERMQSRQLGPQVLTLPEGPALCTDARSVTVITAEDDDGKFVMLIAVASHDGCHLGALSPMTPAEARNLGASLIASANQIDGGVRG